MREREKEREGVGERRELYVIITGNHINILTLFHKIQIYMKYWMIYSIKRGEVLGQDIIYIKVF